MGKVTRIRFEEPPDLLVELEERVQTRLFEPWDCPGSPAAGMGRPAEGPIKPFFKLLYGQRCGVYQVPEEVTEQWFARQGLAPNNEGRLLHTLKYVGLVDASGMPEWDLWHMNRADLENPTAIYRELLQCGYRDLEELLPDCPCWRTVYWWLQARLNGSKQMLQRRFGFYQHLRLAMHSSVQGYDSLMREARRVDWNALLPPVPPGGPKLVVLGRDTIPSALLRDTPVPSRQEPKRQLTFRFPPSLEVVDGGLI